MNCRFSMPIKLAATRQASLVGLGIETLPRWLTTQDAENVATLEAPSFPPSEYSDRWTRLRSSFSLNKIDAVLAFRPSTVEYLCGFHTVNPYPQPVLITNHDIRLYTLDIELGRAIASSVVDRINFFATGAVGGVAADTIALIAKDVANELGQNDRLGLDFSSTHVPPSLVSVLLEAGVEVVDCGDMVERQRLILSAREIDKMKTAAEVTKLGLAAAVDAAAEHDATDSSVAAAIASALAECADSTAAIAPIVATGPRAGVQHSSNCGMRLAEGTTLLEFSGTCRRYHAPLMATIARGDIAAEERRLERCAQEVLSLVLAEARPGRNAAEVARTVAAGISSIHDDDIFHWNFGYAVGLAHPPTWADGADWSIIDSNDGILESGMAFHVAASSRRLGRVAVGLSHTILLDRKSAHALTGQDARVMVV